MSTVVMNLALSGATSGNTTLDERVTGIVTSVYIKANTVSSTATVTVSAEGPYSTTIVAVSSFSASAEYHPTVLQDDTAGADGSNRQPYYVDNRPLKLALASATDGDDVTVYVNML